MCLPDIHTKAFAEQARRDSLAIARSETEAADQAWVDGMQRGVCELDEAPTLADRIDATPIDLSARKKHHLKALGYGRKRRRIT